jgi:hypothetical protein
MAQDLRANPSHARVWLWCRSITSIDVATSQGDRSGGERLGSACALPSVVSLKVHRNGLGPTSFMCLVVYFSLSADLDRFPKAAGSPFFFFGLCLAFSRLCVAFSSFFLFLFYFSFFFRPMFLACIYFFLLYIFFSFSIYFRFYIFRKYFHFCSLIFSFTFIFVPWCIAICSFIQKSFSLLFFLKFHNIFIPWCFYVPYVVQLCSLIYSYLFIVIQRFVPHILE